MIHQVLGGNIEARLKLWLLMGIKDRWMIFAGIDHITGQRGFLRQDLHQFGPVKTA